MANAISKALMVKIEVRETDRKTFPRTPLAPRLEQNEGHTMT